MKKKPLCAAFVDFHARRELEKLTGVTPVNDEGTNINWNVPRLLNVIFSDTFANRFAMCGQALDKEELDNGIEVDQLLFTDVVVAYNDSTNAAYGKLAYQSVPRIQHPSMFEALSTKNSWKVVQTKYTRLGGKYEKYLRILFKSGTHCAFDDLDNINPDPEKCPSPCIIYMHHHMRDRPSLLNACVSFLPKDVVSQSNIRGDRTRRTAEVETTPGERRGPCSRGKKGGFAKSASTRLALQYIASENNANAQLIVAEEQQLVMKSEKIYELISTT